LIYWRKEGAVSTTSPIEKSSNTYYERVIGIETGIADLTKVVKLIAPGYYFRVFGKYLKNCQRWLMKCNSRIFPHIQGYILLHLE
jgi:hypothetical protein